MKELLLSICIPTYQRAGYLNTCLQSLVDQDLLNVEIVVRDNASSDDTESLLLSYQNRLPLRYEISPENQGGDRNFGQVVKLARGKFCWLLGDDDAALPNAVARIKDTLTREDPFVLQLGYVQANSELSPLYDVKAGQPRGAFNQTDLPGTFASQPNVSLLLAFISSFVFRRSSWDFSEASEKWYGTNYVHMFQLHNALSKANCPVIAALEQPAVIGRGNIANVITAKLGEIMWLDARTLASICVTIYGSDSRMVRAVGSVFRKTYPWRTIASVLAQSGKKIDGRTIDALVVLGYSQLQLKLAALIGQPFLRTLALQLVSNPKK